MSFSLLSPLLPPLLARHAISCSPRFAAQIDTILIDDTPDGRQVAENVSIDGSVRSAFSFVQLGREIDYARVASLASELATGPDRQLGLLAELAFLTDTPAPTLVTVTSSLELTPASLESEIVPTLKALESFGSVVSDVSGKPFDRSIKSISQQSPVSISLTGFREAIELALGMGDPLEARKCKKD